MRRKRVRESPFGLNHLTPPLYSENPVKILGRKANSDPRSCECCVRRKVCCNNAVTQLSSTARCWLELDQALLTLKHSHIISHGSVTSDYTECPKILKIIYFGSMLRKVLDSYFFQQFISSYALLVFFHNMLDIA